MCAGIFMVMISMGLHAQDLEILDQEYPDLYEFVYQRDARGILEFTRHENPQIRKQAWRALVSTPVDNMDDFISRVSSDNSYPAWKALSKKSLDTLALDKLHELWISEPQKRAGINLVLGMQGDAMSLDFLLQHFDELQASGDEFENGLAIGRLIGEYGSPEEFEERIIEHALTLENVKNSRAWLYGYYRGEQEMKHASSVAMIRESYTKTEHPLLKQYLLKIAFLNLGEEFLGDINMASIPGLNVQVAVELGQQTSRLPWSDELQGLYLQLLVHENPVVNDLALGTISVKKGARGSIDEFIEKEIIMNEEKEPSVRLSGILAHSQPEKFQILTEELSAPGDYLLIKRFEIWEEILDAEEYFRQLALATQSEQRREVLFAMQAMNQWWPGLPAPEKNAVGAEKVRQLLFEILERGDRSITYSIGALLNSPDLIRDTDFPVFVEMLKKFRLPEDVEVYQAVTGVLNNRFEEEAKPLIDSLAAIGNSALNNTLRAQGWEIGEGESEPVTFRPVNWERLKDLGEKPLWVLETEKGTIKIEMKVLSAPATISGIDSLSRAGAYDNVAFHRVVPNFVIQGGDVETGDGFGGPDYVVPTESSGEQYWRGQVGIASAGNDTEGSQYFIMHQWKPHLNANYTIIGSVREGMDVADRIMVGDKVIKAYWQLD